MKVYLAWKIRAFGDELLGVFLNLQDAKNMVDACDEECWVSEKEVIE